MRFTFINLKFLNAISFLMLVVLVLFALFENVIQIYYETLFMLFIGMQIVAGWVVLNLIIAAIKREKSLLIPIILLTVAIGLLIKVDISLERDLFYGKTISKYYYFDDLSSTLLRFRGNQKFEIVEDLILGNNVYVGKYTRSKDTLFLMPDNINGEGGDAWWSSLVEFDSVLISIKNPSATFKRK